jgi:predicted negative regulator of RcsB-dependent stress response
VENYRTEEEQVEALKRWWQENGRSTVAGVVLAIAAVVGWQGWQSSRDAAAADASIVYQQMLQALTSETLADIERGREMAAELKDKHRGSSYAQFAALHLARIAVAEGNSAEAERELRWVLTKADGQVRDLAQLRLAQVLADQGKTEEALTMLAAGQGGDLAAMYAMARGDTLLAAGRDEEARLAYEAAATALGTDAPLPRMLSDKLDYLSAAAAAPEAG